MNFCLKVKIVKILVQTKYQIGIQQSQSMSSLASSQY